MKHRFLRDRGWRDQQPPELRPAPFGRAISGRRSARSHHLRHQLIDGDDGEPPGLVSQSQDSFVHSLESAEPLPEEPGVPVANEARDETVE